MMSCVILMLILFCCCCFFSPYCKFSGEPWYNSQKRRSKPPYASTVEEEITGLLIRLSAFCLILRASCSNWLLDRRTLRGWSFITCGGGGGNGQAAILLGSHFKTLFCFGGHFPITDHLGGGSF